MPAEPVGLRLEAPAKVNIDLKVLGREPSGYHQIETHFAAVALCDVITAVPTDGDLELVVEGADLGDTRDNLVYRAAAAFLAEAEWSSGARLHLLKRIPAGSGLGGGSSDAAATLKLLNRMTAYGLAEDAVNEIGRKLGADVPFFLSAEPCALGFDRGDRLMPVDPLPSTPAVIALPDIHVSSAEAYERLAEARGGDAAFATELYSEVVNVRRVPDWRGAADGAVNDFEPIIFDLHPQLGVMRDGLDEAGAFLARLSGSGSAVFGLFEDADAAEEAAEELAQAHPTVEFVVSHTLTQWPGIDITEG